MSMDIDSGIGQFKMDLIQSADFIFALDQKSLFPGTDRVDSPGAALAHHS